MLKAHLRFRPHRWAILVIATMFWASAALVHARPWHNKDGRTIEAEFVSLRGERLTLDKGGKKVTFDINLLTDEDQATARALALVKNPANDADEDNPFGDSDDNDSSAKPSGNKPGSNKPSKKEDEDDDANEPVSNKVRPWTDVLGNRVVGRFVSIAGDTVSIRKRDRTIVPVDYFKLVDEDQRYIANLLEKAGQGSLIPKPKTAAAGAAPITPNAPPPRPPVGVPTFNSTPTSPMPFGGSPTGSISSSPMPSPSALPGSPPPGASFGSNGLPVAGGSPPPTPYSSSGTSGGAYASTPTGGTPSPGSPPLGSSGSNPSSFGSSPTGSPPSTAPTNFGPPRTPAPFSSTPPTAAPPVSDFGAPRMVKICESCNREVSNQLTAGDSCPHCGVTFTMDRTNGKVSVGRLRIGRLIGVGISLVVILIGGISAFCTWLVGGKN